MHNLYFDHNVAYEIAALLRTLGYIVVVAGEIRSARRTDEWHMLYAAEQGYTLVTHNIKDFELLHDAWLRWSRAWEVQPDHAGILIIPDKWSDEFAAEQLDRFLRRGLDFTNALHRWRASTGWQSRPLPT